MKIGKTKKHLANLYEKNRKCYTHRKFKTCINHKLILTKAHRDIN